MSRTIRTNEKESTLVPSGHVSISERENIIFLNDNFTGNESGVSVPTLVLRSWVTGCDRVSHSHGGFCNFVLPVKEGNRIGNPGTGILKRVGAFISDSSDVNTFQLFSVVFFLSFTAVNVFVTVQKDLYTCMHGTMVVSFLVHKNSVSKIIDCTRNHLSKMVKSN